MRCVTLSAVLLALLLGSIGGQTTPTAAEPDATGRPTSTTTTTSADESPATAADVPDDETPADFDPSDLKLQPGKARPDHQYVMTHDLSDDEIMRILHLPIDDLDSYELAYTNPLFKDHGMVYGFDGTEKADKSKPAADQSSSGHESLEAQRQRTFDAQYQAAVRLTKADPYVNPFAHLALLGHAPSQLQVIWRVLLGIGSNMGQMVPQLQRLAARGYAQAHMALGFMYSQGIEVPASQARAILHYTFAAQADDPWAQMALGYRYWAGVGVPANCERALALYKRVAVRVASQVTFAGGPAVHRVRLLDEAENSGPSSGYIDTDLIEYYQLLADKGDIQSQLGLGQLHYQGGRGVQHDLQKAMQYFKPAAAAGNAMAMGYLGKIYLEGNEFVPASNETALKLFTKAAELGNPVGQSGLGIMYLTGRGVKRDKAKAYQYFMLAAEQGWVDGQLQLGNMFFAGNGVARDFKMATKYFNLASQSGHVLAYFNLGQINSYGLGGLRSCPTAVELFKNVAERGPWSEMLMQAHHEHRLNSYQMAYRKYALLAEMGSECAQSNAAYILDQPWPLLHATRHEELVRALQMWGRSAAQGYSAAQVKLGDYHYYGYGTPVDYETAASHYRSASEQHHNAQAMFNMGYMHEQGLGMERDWHLAKRHYDQAAATSGDAWIPVALALLRLSLMVHLESIKEFTWFGDAWTETSEHLIANWDLYLISILTLVFGLFIYLQRPEEGRPAQQQQQQQQQRQAAAAGEPANEAQRPNAPDEAHPLLDDVQ